MSIVVAAVVALAAAGCAASSKKSTSDRIEQLERQVAVLSAQKANVEAESNALDDEVVIYRKKLEKCRESAHPRRSVVRLRRGEDGEAAAV